MSDPAEPRRALRPTTHRIRNYFIGLAATLLVVVLGIVGFLVVKSAVDEHETAQEQAELAPFYRPPAGWRDAELGTVFRKQRLGGVPADGRGWRILYRTERSDGAPAVSGGMVFAPSGRVPEAPRPVVAWAHGTVGMGDACAPSRSPTGVEEVPGLALFLEQGWVVVATDYAGLGTPGVLEYLVGDAEARDVVTSVRAAQHLDVGAGDRVALWGHSQGGHSVLWTEALAPELAPQLEIVGAASAAPAAELVPLFRAQWDTVPGSLIGSELLIAWPEAYPGLSATPVVSGDLDVQAVADKCVIAAALDLQLRSLFGQQMFRVDPMTVPAWRRVAQQNTPPPPIAAVPNLIAQGLDDAVVLPGSTATYVERSCAAGSDLTVAWLGGVGHIPAGMTAAPLAATWFQQRFAGVPSTSTCGTTPPVAPL